MCDSIKLYVIHFVYTESFWVDFWHSSKPDIHVEHYGDDTACICVSYGVCNRSEL